MMYYKNYYVYILSSISKVLYIGVTNNIERRIKEHKSGNTKGFTRKYKCNRLVYLEEYQRIEDAITREKQLKKWSRKKKVLLIEMKNPKFKDLSE